MLFKFSLKSRFSQLLNKRSEDPIFASKTLARLQGFKRLFEIKT